MRASNHLEIEIKIKIDDTAAINNRLIECGFRVFHKRSFEYNIVFDSADYRLAQKNCLLRLRKTGSRNTLTFKSPSPEKQKTAGYKIREEIETMVKDFDIFKAILLGLGLDIVFIYEKYRQVYTRGKVTVMMDETPIGNFIEIEGREVEIDTVSGELGFTKDDYIVENYRSLFYKTGQKGFMTFA